MSARKCFVLGWCLIAAAAGAAVFAEGAGLRGTVADSSGKPLAKVKITLQGEGFEFERATKTNKKGEFEFTLTEAEGSYRVRLEKEGFLTQDEPFEIPAGQVTTVNWTLYTAAEATQHAEQIQALQAKDKATKAYNAGADAYNEKDVDTAIAHFREAIEANPELDLAHAALARVLLENERWAEARAAAEAFLEVKPEEPLALQTLYDAYWGEDNKEEADKVLARLAAVQPGDAVAARIFNQAVAATRKQDYEAAAKGFEKAYELDSSLHQALLPLAQIHYSKSEWQGAIDRAEAYLEHDKANARAHIVRYLSYRELGNQEAAEAAFGQLSEGSPKAAAEMFLRDGINYFNDGAIPKSIEAVETSIKLDPENPKAHHQLGLCYSSSGENDKARAAFEKFLELAPEDSEAATVKEMLTYLK